MTHGNNKEMKINWVKVIPSREIQHMLPVKNNEGKRVFTLLMGVMLIPLLIGIPMVLLSLNKPKKYKNIRVGNCPICEASLGFEKSVTSFNCPECKCRSVIVKDKVRSI